MKYRNVAIACCLIWLLCGCAPYQGSRIPMLRGLGGHWEEKGPGELIKVGVDGARLTSHSKLGSYLLVRCAEVAKRQKKPFFAFYVNLAEAVANKRSDTKLVTTVARFPTVYAYILLFDEPEPGLLNAAEVISRLGSEISAGESK